MHLKLKLERVEKERNELRLTTDRLESKVRYESGLTSELPKAGVNRKREHSRTT